MSGIRLAAVAFAAAFLLVAAPLAHVLRQTDFPVVSAEAGLAASAIAVGAALFALLHAWAGAAPRALLEALLTTFAVDLLAGSEYISIPAGVAIFFIARARRVSMLPPAAIMGAVLLATTLAGLGGSREWMVRTEGTAQAPPAPELPTIVHIILDEHIGIEGLPADNPGSAALRDDLRAFFLARGFVLYGRAFSEHLHTVNALPHILNYGTRTGEQHDLEGARVGRTLWLDALARGGFRLRLYQSDFADFCSGAAYADCHTYAHDSLRPVLGLPPSPAARARFILVRLLGRSPIVTALDSARRVLTVAAGKPAPWQDLKQRSVTSALVSHAAFDRLIEDLRGARPGDAFVAHILLPHVPYVTDRNCRFLPRRRWDTHLPPSSRRVREDRYFEQLRCTMRRLGAALDAVAASPGGRNLVLVVHGDHGSRLADTSPDAANAGRFDDADLIAGFSTLFAVRAPALDPAYVEPPAPVSALLRDFARSGFGVAPTPAPGPHSVAIDDEEWTPQMSVPFAPEW